MLSFFLLVGVTGLEPAASWSQTTRATNCATPRYLFDFKITSCSPAFLRGFTKPRGFLLQLRLCRRALRSLANRQVAATPFPSLLPPPAALGNVPNCATPRNMAMRRGYPRRIILYQNCVYLSISLSVKRVISYLRHDGPVVRYP